MTPGLTIAQKMASLVLAVGHDIGNGVKWDLPQEADAPGYTFSRILHMF
jgi:hypothetical protein